MVRIVVIITYRTLPSIRAREELEYPLVCADIYAGEVF